MTAGNIRPWPTSVTRITENVRKRIRSRSGNGWPLAVVNGMASAAARDTMPRTPVNPSMNGHCHGGEGSLRAIAGINQRGKYVAGNTHTNRAKITTTLTTAADPTRADHE